MFPLLLAAAAWSATIVGNPNVVIETAGQGSLLLWTLELTRCDTEEVIALPLRQEISPQSPLSVPLPTGDFCELDAVLNGPPNAQILVSPEGDTLDIQVGATPQVTLTLDETAGAVWMAAQ